MRDGPPAIAGKFIDHCVTACLDPAKARNSELGEMPNQAEGPPLRQILRAG